MSAAIAIYDVLPPTRVSFDAALSALQSGNCPGFLQQLASRELADYTPLEDILRQLTNVVRLRLAEPPKHNGAIDQVAAQNPNNWQSRVQVVPRGSFVSRTALNDSVDLDLDFIIPDDYFIPHPIPGVEGAMIPIRDALQLDQYGESILFPPNDLKLVLQTIWGLLNNPNSGLQTNHLLASSFLGLMRTAHDFTRSIDARTLNTPSGLHGPLPVDIFIKIRTKIRGVEWIIGVDKDGPGGFRRYQITEYFPIEGKWIGDRILGPVERSALLMLKWWKTTGAHPLKSHHLLSALDAISELDPKDQLYHPLKSSIPFSTLRVMEVMVYTLMYLERAYSTPCNFLLRRTTLVGSEQKTVTQYPFPEVCPLCKRDS